MMLRRLRRHGGVRLISLVLLLFISSFYLSLLRTTSWDRWTPKHPDRITFNHSRYIQHFPFTRTGLNRILTILLWTPFGDANWGLRDLSTAFSSCQVSNCVLTNQKTDIVMADVILFHAFDLWNYFRGYELPKYRRENQVYVFSSFESPAMFPISNEFDGLFNWTFSYRRQADLQFQYGDFQKLAHKKPLYDVASTKMAGIAWVASNCGDSARRQLLVREIQKYIQVDTYGFCGENGNLKENIDDVLRNYKFYLSFENAHCRDYITEKFYRPYTHHSLPVVSGSGDYNKVAPPNSYIDVRDFDNVEELATYLKYLDSNDTAYNSYFHWTSEFNARVTPPFWCALCEAAHDNTKVHQVYTDMEGYYNDDTCQKWTISNYVYRIAQGYAVRFGLL